MNANTTKPVLNTYWFYMDMFVREKEFLSLFIPAGFALYLCLCCHRCPYSDQLVPPHSVP